MNGCARSDVSRSVQYSVLTTRPLSLVGIGAVMRGLYGVSGLGDIWEGTNAGR